MHNPKLTADVQVSSTYLIVTNKDDVEWKNCDYSIGSHTNPNDFYELGIFGSNFTNIEAHKTIYIPWGDLTKQDGTRFNYNNQKPSDLVIDCSSGGKDAEWKNY